MVMATANIGIRRRLSFIDFPQTHKRAQMRHERHLTTRCQGKLVGKTGKGLSSNRCAIHS
jgi:hypothetical protein